MLTVEKVDLKYGAAQVLWGVDLTAERGKVTCLMGRNGVGKSSLLRGIVGHHQRSASWIWSKLDLLNISRFAKMK